jgi:hypothetical protein
MRMIKAMQNGIVFYVVADYNRVHYRSMDKGAAKRELRLRSGRRSAKLDSNRQAWVWVAL